MSRTMLSSDLHLGHDNAFNWRPEFSSSEEHHEVLFDNLASNVTKRDTLILLGDICFSKYWLNKIEDLKVNKKILIVGNHDTERGGITMRHIVNAYDEVHSMLSYRNFWFTHCPIHPQEMRGRKANIHGHLHGNMVWHNSSPNEVDGMDRINTDYINVCIEHTDWKPITFQDAVAGVL